MKRYELSMTRDYVSSWSFIEAIRELIQNAYDSPGKEVISIKENSISISNIGVSIASSTLALGKTTKKDDDEKVGCYGEGYKLALLVLLREGYEITILNGDKVWTPSFEHSDIFETEVLCINEEEENSDGNNLTFIINNIPSYKIEEIKNEFLGLDNENYKYIKTMYGQIITDKKYAGKMFVNGLPIFKDEKFKYGYNFKPQYVNLDRDRKSINIRDLQRITALAMTYMEEPDFSIVDAVIDSSSKDSDDAKYIKDGYISLNEEFVSGYSDHLKNKFNIDDKTVVLPKTNDELIKEIEKKQKAGEEIKVVLTPNKTYADIINRRSEYSSNFINDLHNEINHRSSIDNAWNNYQYSNYREFKEWFDEYRNYLPEEAIEKFNALLFNIEPSGFYLIKGEL